MNGSMALRLTAKAQDLASNEGVGGGLLTRVANVASRLGLAIRDKAGEIHPSLRTME